MKRVSIYVLFGLSILTAFVIFDYWSNRSDWLEWYRNDYAHRADRLNDEALVARSFYIATHDDGQLSDLLESRRHMGAINFWLIQNGDKIDNSSLTASEAADYKFDLNQNPGSVLTDRQHRGDFFYAVDTLAAEGKEGPKLVLGIRRSESAFLDREFDLQKFFLIRYVCGIAIVAFAIFVFFFRDIMTSLNWLSKGRKGLPNGGGPANSREAELLRRGLQSFEVEARDLKESNQLLASQVLPSLKSELMAGREPPYEFACTLVRLDMNSFSTIYAQHPAAVISGVLSDFFIEASRTIERHSGLVHEFIGDEIIFYFKDEATPDSIAMAASAVFAINTIAERFHTQTVKEHGFPFTVKSTFAHGTLRYGRFVGGFNITGAAMIETVRVLSEINDRGENKIVFDERHQNSFAKIATAIFDHEAQLKGLPKPLRLHVAISRRTLQDIWFAQDLPSFAYLRSDTDILELLRLGRQTDLLDPRVKRAVRHLRRLPPLPFTEDAHRELLGWIGDLLVQSEAAKEPGRTHLRLIASLVRLSDRLPLTSNLEHNRETHDLLLNALNTGDERVAANALETIMGLNRSSRHRDRSTDPAEWLQDSRARVSINALIWMASREFDRTVVRRLKRLLASRVGGQKSSAIFAIGEIASDYRHRDPVHYSAQTSLLELVEKLPQFCVSPDENIAQQALIAIGKIQDPQLVAAVLKLAETSASEFQRSRILRQLQKNAKRSA